MGRYLFILLMAGALHQQVALAECAKSPATTAKIFYAWYVKQISDQKYPLSDEPEHLKTYVTIGLISHIQQQIASPDGLDEDYFLKAQDYMDDWLTHIEVSELKIEAGTAQERVTLGKEPNTRQTLDTQLVLDKGCWKINEVAAFDTQEDSVPQQDEEQ